MSSPLLPLLPRLARRVSFGSSSGASSSVLPAATSSSSARRSISSSAPKHVRRPDEWSYPSIEGDNKPRRPFLNPDVSDKIPNEVARRAGVAPYRLPSGALDIYELPPKLPHVYDVLTHTITFTAFDSESLRAYSAMARHAALALLIPITGPRSFKPVLERWSSNRSPFVQSGSKELFERRTFHVEMDVWDADDKAAEILVKILLATGRGEHVKVKVEKYSRGEFHLHSDSPTTAPLTHASKRMQALVQEIADRFIREEKSRIDNMSEFERQLHDSNEKAAADKDLTEDERIAKEAASIQSGMPPDVVVPTDEPVTITDAATKTSSFSPSPAADSETSASSGGDKIPEYAGQKVWERHNQELASSPRAKAQAKLAALPPSNTVQIFHTSPILVSSDEQSSLLTTEQVSELIRPLVHLRSTFHVSSSSLSRTPSAPFAKPSLEIPPPPKVKKQFVSPEKNAFEQTRKQTIRSMPLPGEGSYFLVEFESTLEAHRVREALDDRVLADGTSLDVWFHKSIEEAAEAEGGSLQGVQWAEIRGAASGDMWREVDLEAERLKYEQTSGQTKEAARLKRERAKEVEAEVRKLKEAEEAEEKRLRDEEAAKLAPPAAALETVAEEAEEAKETVADKAEDVKETVADNVAAAKEAVEDKIENAPSASEVKDSALETAQETKETVVEKVEEVKETVQEKLADAPTAAELQESATETASDIKDTVFDKAQDLKDSVEEKIAEAPSASEIKGSAASTAESVKESVTETASSVKASVEDKVEEVKPQAESFVESIKAKAAEVQEAVVEKAAEVKETVVEKVEDVKETVGEAEKKVESEVEERKEEVKEIVDEKEQEVQGEVKELEKKAEEKDKSSSEDASKP